MRKQHVISAVLAVAVVLSACGEKEAPQTSTVAAQPTAPPLPPPTPADFKPCDTVTFAAVTVVIGTRPTITTEDVTGTVTSGWATCALNRADGSAGPTMNVNIQKLPSGPQASQRHEQLMRTQSGASPVPGDKDSAYTWIDGNALYIEYVRSWWLTRRVVYGANDAATRAKLLAMPRWP